MADHDGRSFPLSAPRRLVADLLHFARKVPSVPVQRHMHLRGLVQARREAAPAVGWCAIFLKAYGLVAARVPELRRAYLPFPYPRLYQHPASIASVAVERAYRGQNAVFFAHIRGPENHPLRSLHALLRRFKEEPVERFGRFRQVLRLARLPRPLRRTLWWVSLNSSGPLRARRLGTFGVSVYSGLGAESLHPLSPLTTTLNYGVIGEDGAVPVRIVYDHRVLDGSTVARALALLEEVLADEIRAELLEGWSSPQAEEQLAHAAGK